MKIWFMKHLHFVKSVRNRSYSGPHFPAFGPYSIRMRQNADQNNSENEHFSRSVVSISSSKERMWNRRNTPKKDN